MKTTAIPAPRLQSASQSASWPGLRARLSDFVTLMKLRVMLLAVFTALVGLMTAPSRLDPLPASFAILGIAAGAGAAAMHALSDSKADGAPSTAFARLTPLAAAVSV